MKIAEAAEAVMKDASGPMRARDIAAAIEQRKLFTFQTKDPTSVVGRALRKSEKFTRTDAGTFELKR